MKNNATIGLLSFLMLVAGCWAISGKTARAQEAHEAQGHDEHEAHKKNEIGVFAGGLTNLDKDVSGPSIGVDYTRRLTPKIGIGVIYEFASTSTERENLFAGALIVEPGHNFKLTFAPGAVRINEDEEEEEEHHGEDDQDETPTCCHSTTSVAFVGRLGITYLFEFSRVTVGPAFFVDLISNGEVHLVYGVSIGFPF